MFRRWWAVIALAAPAALVPVGPATAAPDRRCAGYTDSAGSEPWPIHRLAPQRAWPVSRGRGVTVAVLDSGVNGHHPQLTGRVLPGTDLVRGKGSADTDCVGHGSIVAGIIAARDTDRSEFAGVAPDATVLPVRITDDDRPFTGGSPRIAAAVRYAVDHGATVVNMSLTTQDSPELRSAVRYAHAHDVVLVAAAGNEADSTTGPIYPAAYPDVLAVSGIDEKGGHVSAANTGDWVDLAAPGDRIVGPAATTAGYSAPATGTSFAAPYVSGAAALIRSYRPDLRAADVARRLEVTADHPAGGRNTLVGYGVVNPYRALTAILDDRPAPPAAGRLPAAATPARPPDRPRTVALWSAVAAAVLVATLLLGVAVIPQGRRRRWRPALHPPLPAPPPRRQPTPDPPPPTPQPPTASGPPHNASPPHNPAFTVKVDFH